EYENAVLDHDLVAVLEEDARAAEIAVAGLYAPCRPDFVELQHISAGFEHPVNRGTLLVFGDQRAGLDDLEMAARFQQAGVAGNVRKARQQIVTVLLASTPTDPDRHNRQS